MFENWFFGFPKYWEKMRDFSRGEGGPAFGFWSGALSAVVYARRSFWLGIFLGVAFGGVVGFLVYFFTR